MSEEDSPSRPTLTVEPREEPAEKPPSRISRIDFRRPARRAAQSVSITLLFLIGLGAVSWVNRADIVNAVGPRAISTTIGVDADFKLDRFDLDAARIVDFSIGNGAKIDAIDITFGSGPGPGVPIDRITIDGLALNVYLDPDGKPVIEGLEPLFKSGGETQQSPAALPSIPFRALDLTRATVNAETPIGPQTLTGDISLALPGAPSLYPLAVSLDLDAPGTDSALSLDAALAPDGASLKGTVDVSASHWAPFAPGIRQASGRLTADIDAAGGESLTRPDATDPVAWLLTSLSGAAVLSWTRLDLETDTAPPMTITPGRADLSIGGGQIAMDLAGPVTTSLESAPEPLMALIPEEFRTAFSGAPTVVTSPDADRPSLLIRPDAGGAWRLDTGLTLSLTQGPLRAAVTPDRLVLDSVFKPTTALVHLVQLDLVRGLALPRDIAVGIEAGPFELDLGAAGDGVPDLETPFNVEGAVFGDLAPPVWASRVDIDANGVLRISDGASSVAIDLAPGTRLSARGLTGTGDVRLSPDIDLAVVGRRPFAVTLSPTLTARGAARVSPITLALPDEDPPVSLAFGAQSFRVRHTPTRTVLSTDPVGVTEIETGFGVRGLTLNAEKQADRATLDIDADGLVLAGAPILPGAFAVDLQLKTRPDGGLHAVSGPVRLADGRIALDVSLELPVSDGPLGALITSEPIRFGAGGLATSDFVPAPLLEDLPAVPQVSGAVALELFLSLSDADADVLTLDLDGLSLEAQGFGVKDVTGTLSFDPKALPASLGEQEISGIVAAPVLGRAPMTARFSVGADASARIGEATLSALGGDISLIDAAYDPAITEVAGTLRLRRLGLSNLTAALAVEGVSASGQLSGLLPTRVSPEILVVTNGTIAADGGGTLSITNPAVSQALASDNQAVQLLSEALQNFEYETFAATLDISTAGAGALGLSLQGANPEVLDGYPFDINVNLETDLTQFAQIQRDLFRILNTFVTPLRVLDPDQLPVSSDGNSG